MSLLLWQNNKRQEFSLTGMITGSLQNVCLMQTKIGYKDRSCVRVGCSFCLTSEVYSTCILFNDHQGAIHVVAKGSTPIEVCGKMVFRFYFFDESVGSVTHFG